MPLPHLQAFKPGSVAPPARLLDARELFDQGSARADRLLRDIGPDLGAAVEACIAAAGEGMLVYQGTASSWCK
jgi:hypothetical protein